MSNVINLFGDTEVERMNAVAVLQGRIDELDADDTFTDVLIVTYGEDGIAIKTNCGGLAETNIMLDMVKSQLVQMVMFGDEYDGEEDY